MPHKSFVLIIVISTKCNTANPLTGFVAGVVVGHFGGTEGVLEFADELVNHLIRCVPAGH